MILWMWLGPQRKNREKKETGRGSYILSSLLGSFECLLLPVVLQASVLFPIRTLSMLFFGSRHITVQSPLVLFVK